MNVRRPAVVGVIGVTAVAVGFLLWFLTAGDPDPAIARVEGIEITQSRADSRIEGLASMHGDIEGTLGPEWRSVILDSLVDDVIVQIEGERLGLTASDGDIQAEVEDTKRLVGDDDQWEQWLAELGIDDEELKRRVANQIVTNRVFDHVTGSIQATETAAREYYDDHPEVFTLADGGIQDFEDVRDLIMEDLAAKARDAAYREWLSTRRSEVDIEVIDDDWR